MTTPTLDCPVCPRRGLTAAAGRCPGCGTDLLPLWRLRELPDAYASEGLAYLEQGRPDEALLRLRAAVALADGAERRLLLGDVLSRMGHHEEARQHWHRAREQGADEAAGARLSEAQGAGPPVGPVPVRGGRVASGPLVALVLTIGGLVAAGFLLQRSDDRESPVAPRTDISVPKGTASALPPALNGRMAAIAGVRVHHAEGVTVALVDADVFAAGEADVLPAARWTLAEVGRVLRDAAAMVVVEGHTDGRPVRPGGRWRTNHALGLARAVAAAEFLKAAGIPSTRLAAAVGSDSHVPRRSVAVRVLPLPQ